MNRDFNKLEKKEASKDGAKLVRNSGRGAEKGDAKFDDFLLDYKFNEKSFSLSLANWLKLKKDAWKNNQRDPLIKVVFDGKNTVAILPWDTFMEMRNGSPS